MACSVGGKLVSCAVLVLAGCGAGVQNTSSPPLSAKEIKVLASACHVDAEIEWAGAIMSREHDLGSLYCRFDLAERHCRCDHLWPNARRLSLNELGDATQEASHTLQSTIDKLSRGIARNYYDQWQDIPWWNASPLQRDDILLIENTANLCLLRSEGGKCVLYVRVDFLKIPTSVIRIMNEGHQPSVSDWWPSHSIERVRSVK